MPCTTPFYQLGIKGSDTQHQCTLSRLNNLRLRGESQDWVAPSSLSTSVPQVPLSTYKSVLWAKSVWFSKTFIFFPAGAPPDWFLCELNSITKRKYEIFLKNVSKNHLYQSLKNFCNLLLHPNYQRIRKIKLKVFNRLCQSLKKNLSPSLLSPPPPTSIIYLLYMRKHQSSLMPPAPI